MNTKPSRYLMITIISFTLVIILAVVIGIISLTQKETSAQTLNEHTIITENGYKVVKDNDPDRQTVIATVISKTNDGKYYTAINNYDANDTITIDVQFSKGDKVMITFLHDDIESVKIMERNEL